MFQLHYTRCDCRHHRQNTVKIKDHQNVTQHWMWRCLRGLGRVLYQSCVAVLGCLATLSENFFHRSLTQDQMRKEGKYPLWLQIHVPEYLFAVLSNFRITENIAYRTPANRVPRGTIFQTSVLRGTQFKGGLYFFSHNFLQ